MQHLGVVPAVQQLGKHGVWVQGNAAVVASCSGVQQDDSSRLAQLRCHTARAGHMYRKFTWGNRESLVARPAERGVDVHAALVDYYRRALNPNP